MSLKKELAKSILDSILGRNCKPRSSVLAESRSCNRDEVILKITQGDAGQLKALLTVG
jgi:hypothetical protein